MKEKIDYSALENMPKQDRRQKLYDSGILDQKRFLLPANENLRERLNAIRIVVDDLKKIYPEVVSFGLFGSNTKGYATEQSDIDGFLYIDLREAFKNYYANNPKTTIKEDMAIIKVRFLKLFKNRLQQNSEINDEQIKHIAVNFIDKPTILKIIRDPQLDKRALQELFIFFLLQIGNDIKSYREAIINELSTQEITGQKNGKLSWNA